MFLYLACITGIYFLASTVMSVADVYLISEELGIRNAINRSIYLSNKKEVRDLASYFLKYIICYLKFNLGWHDLIIL